MVYYDPNDKSPRRWAILAAVIYGLLLGGSFLFVSFDMAKHKVRGANEIVIDFTPPVIPPKPDQGETMRAPEKSRDAMQGNKMAKSPERGTGVEKQTRTINQKTLFNQNKAGDDKVKMPSGQPKQKKETKEENAGTGAGYLSEGVSLGEGWRGRGVVGALPRPDYPGTQSGRVVIRVIVDDRGLVTGASFEAVGSTVNNRGLVEAALEAARKARFTKSEATMQSGTIIYDFKME